MTTEIKSIKAVDQPWSLKKTGMKRERVLLQNTSTVRGTNSAPIPIPVDGQAAWPAEADRHSTARRWGTVAGLDADLRSNCPAHPLHGGRILGAESQSR